MIRVDVWSDIACPWCYIGKRTFEVGAAAFRKRHPDVNVSVEFHSFELAPDTPVDFEGSEIDFLVGYKGIPEEQARAMVANVTRIAAGVGLQYDYDALQHTKTLRAHELLHYAKAHGKQLEAMERLMRAYFVEGRHVGRDEELADLATDVGLDREDVLRSLRAGEHRPAVTADMEQAARAGINAVPFFLFDRRYGLPGAQGPETFVEALEEVRRKGAAAA